ncbi:MAG: hypothetical protein FJX75_08480 [Armatimonadetes bacterium]|nr:hypothetical protein [Armatimonadota bacterium]
MGWVLLLLLIVVLPVLSLIAMGIRCRDRALFVLATVGSGVLAGTIAGVVLWGVAQGMGPEAGFGALCVFAVGTFAAAMLAANLAGVLVCASTRRRPWERESERGSEGGPGAAR